MQKAQAFQNILLGGTSHVGKSSLAAALGAELGWNVFSTDKMARHPGRPWPKARPHVAEFYKSMSQESIFTFLLHHHENMWPGIESFLMDQQDARTPCILEGSALRSEFLTKLSPNKYACICLVAPATLIEQRIHASSGYSTLSPDMRRLVDAFVVRSIQDNTLIMDTAGKHEFECVDVSNPTNFDQIRIRLAETAITGRF